MSRRISSPIFVGRAQELGRLEELLGLAGAGTPGSVLVAGEAGVGKTRLVKEFTSRAATAGALLPCARLGPARDGRTRRFNCR